MDIRFTELKTFEKLQKKKKKKTFIKCFNVGGGKLRQYTFSFLL